VPGPEKSRGARCLKVGNEAARERAHVNQRCPFCHDTIEAEALVVRCAVCDTAHHPTCFQDQRGCSVFGCAGKAARVPGRWRGQNYEPGRTKRCAVCKEELDDAALAFFCDACFRGHHPACSEAARGCASCGPRPGGVLMEPPVFRRVVLKPWLAGLILTSSMAAPLAIGFGAAGMIAGPFIVVGILGLFLAVAWIFLGLWLLLRSRRGLAKAQAELRGRTVPPAVEASAKEHDGNG
jgi:hypothetical protein